MKIRTYQQAIDGIPGILAKYSIPDWDGYGALPVIISDALIAKTVELLKKLEALSIICPYISTDGENCLELTWHWSKGDWTISVDEQERYCWDIILDISDEPIDGKDTCMYMNFDVREGVKKTGQINYNAIFFNTSKPIPNQIIEDLKNFEEWLKKNG
jgi:hypothetical protein